MICLYNTSTTKISDLITPKMSILSTSKTTPYSRTFSPRGAVSLSTNIDFGGCGVCYCTLAKIVAISKCMVFKVLFRTLKGSCHGGLPSFWSKLSSDYPSIFLVLGSLLKKDIKWHWQKENKTFMIDFCSFFDNIGSLKVGATFYKLQSLSILAMYNHCWVEVRVISRRQNNYFKVFLNSNAFLGF